MLKMKKIIFIDFNFSSFLRLSRMSLTKAMRPLKSPDEILIPINKIYLLIASLKHVRINFDLFRNFEGFLEKKEYPHSGVPELHRLHSIVTIINNN